ncbi:TetR/AcrR family transcriptional regulator [Lentisphaerota bacterium ZTH]|nr:TetR/AcrR family transcriptional regulator [Lentisphaerota bacterium]WET06729.1 TetR/AcrR family transcriptional regulator [Lentisphaerota bacterium ZTH]
MLSKRQTEIVEIAVDLIACRGIQSLTIKNIANELGVSEPAIYRHFSSKYDIICAVIDSFSAIATGILEKLVDADENALEKIGRFMADRITRISEHPKLAKIMFSEEIFQDDPRLSARMLAMMHSHKAKIAKIILQGQKRGEIREDIPSKTMFRLIFGPMRLLVKQWSMSGFAFDIVDEGSELWHSQRKMLTNPINHKL